MREQGNVRRWDAAKGFGFIQGARSASVFFHIRDFRGSTPPAEGLRERLMSVFDLSQPQADT